jgi:hypothetical protein
MKFEAKQVERRAVIGPTGSATSLAASARELREVNPERAAEFEAHAVRGAELHSRRAAVRAVGSATARFTERRRAP